MDASLPGSCRFRWWLDATGVALLSSESAKSSDGEGGSPLLLPAPPRGRPVLALALFLLLPLLRLGRPAGGEGERRHRGPIALLRCSRASPVTSSPSLNPSLCRIGNSSTRPSNISSSSNYKNSNNNNNTNNSSISSRINIDLIIGSSNSSSNVTIIMARGVQGAVVAAVAAALVVTATTVVVTAPPPVEVRLGTTYVYYYATPLLLIF